MNLIFKLVRLTIIISSLVLLITPSEAYNYSDVEVKPQIPDKPLLPPHVVDTEGKPIETDTSYVILPANTIKGLPENAKGIGLFSSNQTCPFHVALWGTGLPLKLQPLDNLGGVHERISRVDILFDYPGQDCPEPKRWQVIGSPLSSLAVNSRGYVKTGGVRVGKYSGFYIFQVENQKRVYKLGYCDGFLQGDISTSFCKDVNVLTLESNVMALVVNDGVPLHVKFEKA